MIEDIHPQTPISRLRSFSQVGRARTVPTHLAAKVLGMNLNYMVRALGYSSGSRPRSITIAQVLDLLELDEWQETFVPRSRVPDYLLQSTGATTADVISLPADHLSPTLEVGSSTELLGRLAPGSVQCVVTSSPYWGMRLYDNRRDVTWADGAKCPYGFEQTPEGFIRHTTELLYLLLPVLTSTGSVWWNLMDTYNTRTPIRENSRDKLRAMGGHPDHTLGWTQHLACRYSAGHMFLQDGELAMIPARVAERASRIGYRVKSLITWNKNSTPESAKGRVTRQAETILHLAVNANSYFDRDALSGLDMRLGGLDAAVESIEKLTDVWSLAAANGKHGHGAEFPLSLPARCIAIASEKHDVVLDPFIGSGTTALAAMELGRRCVGFDISDNYLKVAERRTRELTLGLTEARLDDVEVEPALKAIRARNSVNGHHANGLPFKTKAGVVANPPARKAMLRRKQASGADKEVPG